jgi:hypothetical protein
MRGGPFTVSTVSRTSELPLGNIAPKENAMLCPNDWSEYKKIRQERAGKSLMV